MDIGLSWINDLVGWLAQWIPRWGICDPTHAGVKFRGRLLRRGIRTVRIDPGLYIWWPATTQVYLIPVVRQSANLPAQSLTSRDGKAILVSTVLVVSISDVEKALTANYDIEDTIREVGSAAAVDCVVLRSWAQLRAAFSDGEINRELTKKARQILRKYGVQVIEARFTDCANHTALRTVGDGGIVIPAESDDE